MSVREIEETQGVVGTFNSRGKMVTYHLWLRNGTVIDDSNVLVAFLGLDQTLSNKKKLFKRWENYWLCNQTKEKIFSLKLMFDSLYIIKSLFYLLLNFN